MDSTNNQAFSDMHTGLINFLNIMRSDNLVRKKSQEKKF